MLEAAEELLADLAETGGYDYRKIYADNRSDIDAFAKDNNYDVTKLSSDDRKKLVKSWIDETGFTPAKPNWFKRLVSNVRIWFHNHGIKIKHLSDDDIANIILRSAKAARDERRSSVVKDNLTTGEGARFMTLKSKPENVDEFLKMPGHTRPPRLNFSNTGEMFDAFKKYILDNDITTPDGYKLEAKEGHFFSFCCSKLKGKTKGFIERAKDAEDALRMVKGSKIEPHEMSGFQLDRIRNINTYVDVLKTPDFSYRDEKKIIYGKKYNDIPHANGFISVVLNVTGDTIVPVSSSMDTFTKEKMKDKKITWFFMSTGESSDLSGAPAGEISEEQSRGYRNISQNPENASPEDKNGPSAAPDGAMEGKRTETDKSDYSDKSDANAMFSLESSGSEELKQQVMAMRPLVGNWLDQDGAEYARRFKEKYGLALDPEEAKLIAALAIRENRSARQKQIAADNAVRAWSYFKSFNPLFDFIANFAVRRNTTATAAPLACRANSPTIGATLQRRGLLTTPFPVGGMIVQ